MLGLVIRLSVGHFLCRAKRNSSLRVLSAVWICMLI